LRHKELVHVPGFAFLAWLLAAVPTAFLIRRIWREWRAFCIGLTAGFIIVMPVLLNP